MTTDQSIALFASIVACFSAIATLLTVRQIAKQREASYLPALSFSRTFFKAGPAIGVVLPLKWVNKKTGSANPTLLDRLSVPLRNIGLGTAKEVTILWELPIDQTIDRINQSAQRTLTPDRIIQSTQLTLTPVYFCNHEGIIRFECQSLGGWKNQKKDSVDFILPASVEKEPTDVMLPQAYIDLCSAIIYLALRDIKTDSLDIPSLTANITYVDIGNRTHYATFAIKLEIPFLTEKMEVFDAYIDCKKLSLPIFPKGSYMNDVKEKSKVDRFLDQFLDVKREEITLKFIFDFIKNLTVSATVIAAGKYLLKPSTPIYMTSYTDDPFGVLLIITGLVLYTLNIVQIISAITTLKASDIKIKIASYIIVFISLYLLWFYIFKNLI